MSDRQERLRSLRSRFDGEAYLMRQMRSLIDAYEAQYGEEEAITLVSRLLEQVEAKLRGKR